LLFAAYQLCPIRYEDAMHSIGRYPDIQEARAERNARQNTDTCTQHEVEVPSQKAPIPSISPERTETERHNRKDLHPITLQVMGIVILTGRRYHVRLGDGTDTTTGFGAAMGDGLPPDAAGSAENPAPIVVEKCWTVRSHGPTTFFEAEEETWMDS